MYFFMYFLDRDIFVFVLGISIRSVLPESLTFNSCLW